jgi:hypothetical protein
LQAIEHDARELHDWLTQLGTYDRDEVRLLVLAYQEGVASALLDASEGAVWELFSEPLETQLVTHAQVSRSEALWAIQC